MSFKDTTRKKKIIIGLVSVVFLVALWVVLFILGFELGKFGALLIIIMLVITLLLSIIIGLFMYILQEYCLKFFE